MKPKEYVKRLKDNFSKDELIRLLIIDFNASLEFHQTNPAWSISHFHVIVDQLQEKYNLLSYSLPEVQKSLSKEYYRVLHAGWGRNCYKIVEQS